MARLFLFILLVLHCNLSARCDERSLENVFSFTIGKLTPILFSEFDIGNVEPGEKVLVTVRFDNQSSEVIPLDNVAVGCKCTSVKFPKKEIAVGAVVDGVFSFAIPESPTQLGELFIVSIFQGKNVIRFNFKASYKNLVAFSQGESIRRIPAFTTKYEFRLPLIASDPAAAKVLRIEATEDFTNMTSKFVHEKDGLWLDCQIENLDLAKPEFSGEVVVIASSGKKSVSRCLLKRNVPVEIAPKSLVLIPENESKEYTAHGILKLSREGESKTSGVLADPIIECVVPDDGRVELKRVTDEVYRFVIRIHDQSKLDSNGVLQLSVRTSFSSPTLLKVRCSFSNKEVVP